jgi:hypothetical protein
MSNKVQVHEFCRAFDNVIYSDKYQEWVSGGYSPKKIANYGKEVPSVIQKAVRDGYFSINDNFPPENERSCVIARELSANKQDGKIYSILAIANRQIDDAGRPTIGYKYFWTDAHDPALDGIVQLLIFWYKNEYVAFEMQELDASYQQNQAKSSPIEISVFEKERTHNIVMDTISYLIVDNSQYDQYSLGMRNTLKCLDTGNYDDILSEIDFYKTHCLALNISKKLKNDNIFSFCSWAFFVTPAHLLYPKSFTCINDKDGKFHINYNAKILLKKTSVQPYLLTTLPDRSINGKTIPLHIEENIKKTLIGIHKSCVSKNHKDLEISTLNDFFQYLIDYKNASWSDCIDDVMLRNNISSYNAIVYLVNSDVKYREKWLNDFFASLEAPRFPNNYFPDLSKKKQSYNISSDVHAKIMDAAFSNSKAKEILMESFFYGITWLLENKCLKIENMIDHKKLQYLFLKSKGIWSQIFEEFASQIVNELEAAKFNDKPSVNSEHVKWFCQNIYDDINSSYKTENTSEYITGKYQRLDCFFKSFSGKKISEIINNKYYQAREERESKHNRKSEKLIAGRNNEGIPNSLSMAITSTSQTPTKYSLEYSDSRSWDEVRPRLTTVVILLVITIIVILLYSNVHDSRSGNYEQNDCKVDSLKNLKIFKKCYEKNETIELVFNDVKKNLFPQDDSRENSHALSSEATEYLKNSSSEDDYKKRILKVKECSKKGEVFNQCLNSINKSHEKQLL